MWSASGEQILSMFLGQWFSLTPYGGLGKSGRCVKQTRDAGAFGRTQTQNDLVLLHTSDVPAEAGTSASLLVTSALLVVTMFASSRNKCLTTRSEDATRGSWPY